MIFTRSPRSIFAALVVVSITSWAGEAIAEPVDEPYVVYVSEDGSYARCGPSGEHYRTDRLGEGEPLEVYIETTDGWLGIRPPETSFCWLPADQIHVDSDGVEGTIVDPEAVAWIGTNLGRARKYLWQVKFQLDESVTIIGETLRETAAGEKETWYRIVPPPGEFRWVHDSQIVHSREELARYHRQQRAEQMAKSAEAKRDQVALQTDPPSISDAPPKPFDVTAATEAAIAQTSGEVGADMVSQAGLEQVDRREAPQSRMNVTDRVRVRNIAPAEAKVASTEQVTPWTQADRSRTAYRDTNRLTESPRSTTTIRRNSDDLQSMQIQFGQLISSSASAVMVDALRLRVERLVTSSSDPVERGRAQLLAERIIKYQDVASRRDGTGRPAPTSSSAPTTFQQQGWLVQVYSARPEAPPFALTDQDGKTIAYLSPSAGMNPRRHLNRKVGIVGRTNYLTGIETPHVIAEQIVRIGQ